MYRFLARLVFDAHRLLYHSILGVRVIKKETKKRGLTATSAPSCNVYLNVYLLSFSQRARGEGPDCTMKVPPPKMSQVNFMGGGQNSSVKLGGGGYFHGERRSEGAGRDRP